MTENLCPIDDVPIKDMAYLCHGCTGQVRDALQAIPELMDELAIMLTKRAKVVQYRTTASTSVDEGKPMVYSEAASRAKSDLKAVLAGWARYVHEERPDRGVIGYTEADGQQVPIYGEVPGTPLTCRDTTTSISGWLIQYLPWLRRQDISPEMHREVVGEVNHIRRLIDAPPATQYIGICGFRWQDVTCTAELWCPVGADEATCRTCGVVWNVDGRRAGAFASVMDRIESPAVIARALGSQGVNITVERINSWKKRGKLEPVACDVKTRRPRYRLGDVMDLWHSTQASPHNSRRPLGEHQ